MKILFDTLKFYDILSDVMSDKNLKVNKGEKNESRSKRQSVNNYS